MITLQDIQDSSWVAKGSGCFGGFDKEGRPSVFAFPALHKTADTDEQVRSTTLHTTKCTTVVLTHSLTHTSQVKLDRKTLCYLIESLVAKMGAGVVSATVVVDFTGTSLQK